jgi:hypothetical protein
MNQRHLLIFGDAQLASEFPGNFPELPRYFAAMAAY